MISELQLTKSWRRLLLDLLLLRGIFSAFLPGNPMLINRSSFFGVALTRHSGCRIDQISFWLMSHGPVVMTPALLLHTRKDSQSTAKTALISVTKSLLPNPHIYIRKDGNNHSMKALNLMKTKLHKLWVHLWTRARTTVTEISIGEVRKCSLLKGRHWLNLLPFTALSLYSSYNISWKYDIL